MMKGSSMGRMVAKTHRACLVQQARVLSTPSGSNGVRLGKVFEQKGCFSSADVESYTHLTGDSNPIHRSSSAAREAGFGACVVPGMLCGSLFPAIIGSRFPGAVYLSQDLRFKAPLLVRESFLAKVEVCTIVKLRQHAKVTFFTRCVRDMEETKPVLLDGQAAALLPISFIDD